MRTIARNRGNRSRSAPVTAKPMIISPSASAQSASESSDSARVAFHEVHIAAENAAFQIVRLLAGFGVKHGDGHKAHPLVCSAGRIGNRATAIRLLRSRSLRPAGG